MGAQNFSETAFGIGAERAFSAAVSESLHEYGHDTYSGTIATKRSEGFIEFTLPPRLSVKKVLDVAWEYTQWMWDTPSGHSLSPSKLRIAEARHEKKRIRILKKLPASMARELPRIVRAMEDKWGACACFKLGPKAAKEYRVRHGLERRKGDVYLFTGTAPS